MCESQGYLEGRRPAFVPVTSAAQWRAIEERLRFFYHLKFRIGETEVGVQKVFYRENQQRLAVYINGKIDYEKVYKSCLQGDADFDPMVVLVWRKMERSLFPSSMLKKKGWSKKMSKKLGLDKKFVCYDPYFASASALVRQFRKIENIEVEW